MCIYAQEHKEESRTWSEKEIKKMLTKSLATHIVNVIKVLLSSFQEKLMYFPVCVRNKKKTEDETEEGLGSLPRNISSVSSLLLFNTTENL